MGSDAASLEICFRRFDATQSLHLQQASSLLKMKALRCLGTLGTDSPTTERRESFLSVCSYSKPVLLEIPDLPFKMWIFGGERSGEGAMFYVRSVLRFTTEQPHTPLSAIYEISC